MCLRVCVCVCVQEKKDSDEQMVLNNSPPGAKVAFYGSSRDVGYGDSEWKLQAAIKAGRIDKGAERVCVLLVWQAYG